MLLALKKRRIPLIVIVGLTILALLAFTFLRGGQPVAQATEEIMTATAQTSTISTTITGTGNLANGAASAVKIPDGLTATQVLVESGDTVQEGDTLAVFDAASVQSRIHAVQAELDALDEEIEAVKDDTESETITSNVSGRVKAVYVDEGDSVPAGVLEHGALMLISLDGLMALSVDTDADLAAGDSVTVTTSDGTDYTGTVESAGGGSCVVTLTDNGPEPDDTATVYDGDGAQLGTGSLYIHQPLTVTGTSGTVDTVHVSENDAVSSGTTLLTLADVAASAEYQALLSQRSDKVALLQALLALAQTNTLTADFSGIVESVSLSAEEDEDANAAAEGTGAVAGGLSDTGDPAGLGVTLLAGGDGENEQADIEITDLDDLGLTAPETGNAPQTILAGEGYTGEVLWTPLDDSFQAGTVYTASVRLTPDSGYGFAEDIARVLGENVPASLPQGADLSDITLEDGGVLAFTVTFPATAAAQDEMPAGDDTASGGSGGSSGGSVSGAAGSSGTVSGDSSSGSASSGGVSATADTAGADDGDTSGDLVTALTISPDDTMGITISVDELDILSLQVGQTARVTLDAIETETFLGTITKVNTTASSSGGVTKYTVEVSIDRTDDMLAGMSASATITIQEAADTLVIPVAALQESAGSVFVYTGLEDDETTLTDPVEVETGLSDGSYVEIVSGLSEGDEIYYSLSVSTDSEVLDTGNFSFDVGGGMGGMPDLDGADMPDFSGGGGGGGDMPSGGGGDGFPGGN